jgi:hypothetical protein
MTLFGCGQQPVIDVVPAIDDEGRVVFDLPRKGIYRLDRFTVKDEQGKLVWDVDSLHEVKQKTWQKITFGVLPPQNKPYSPPQQVFPPEDRPPQDIRGKTVKVIVQYTYDTNLAPYTGIFEKFVSISE